MCVAAGSELYCGYNNQDIPNLIERPVIDIVSSPRQLCFKTEQDLLCVAQTEINGQLVNHIDGTKPRGFHNPHSVILGGSRACVLDDLGAQCWGSNTSGSGEAILPIPQTTTQIAFTDSGDFCYIDILGLTCEGLYSSLVKDVPDNVVRPSKIVGGFAHVCALEEGDVTCWGNTAYNVLAVPDMPYVIELVSEYRMNCATYENGVSCWGINNFDYANLGFTPQLITNDDNKVCFVNSNTEQKTCLDSNGEVITNLSTEQVVNHDQSFSFYCQLNASGFGCDGGSGSLNYTGSTQYENEGSDIFMSDKFICDANGQNCQGEVPAYWSDVVAAGPQSAFDGGSFTACGITLNGFECFAGAPEPTEDMSGASQIIVKDNSLENSGPTYCGISGSGKPVCWGYDGFDHSQVPTDIPAIDKIAMDGRVACGITNSQLYCWGSPHSSLTFPMSFSNITDIAMTHQAVCVISDQQIECVDLEQVGNLDVIRAVNPPKSLGNVSAIAGGRYHFCAITVDEDVQCWGKIAGHQDQFPDTLVSPQKIWARDTNTCVKFSNGTHCAGESKSFINSLSFSNLNSRTPNNDMDNDGLDNYLDNCPNHINEDQADADSDGRGDVCDENDDNDGVLDADDAFPNNIAASRDTDSDGMPDDWHYFCGLSCQESSGLTIDNDDDNDGVSDEDDTDPKDPTVSLDTDNDGIDNSLDPDDDGDGVNDEEDAFPLDNSETTDTDNDGIGNNADSDDDGDGVNDEQDAFPLDASETLDTDNDGIGNNADSDDDGDGVNDDQDAFPLDSSETTDTDSDGIGNNADPDDDGDGVNDDQDAFPLDSSETTDTDSDGIGNNADPDDDGDGVNDEQDAFPLDASETLDTDNDGIGNNADPDDDGDGVNDEQDAFPIDSSETLDTDNDGIGNNADSDDDGDGVSDEQDAFPLDASESTDTDNDGIGNNADLDDDGDGVNDEQDAFPLDSSETLDTDNDGIGNNADPDDDGDGVNDSQDAFPLDPNRSEREETSSSSSSSGGTWHWTGLWLIFSLISIRRLASKRL